MIRASGRTGRIGMESSPAQALASFRQFNYENIYMREASRKQARAVIDLLQALVERYVDSPHLMTSSASAGSPQALHDAVAYVGGMTDRFACRQGITLLQWDEDRLPKGIDV
jgi:dGTPase